MTATILEIEVPGWMLGMLNRNHRLRKGVGDMADQAADLLLSMRLPCKCHTDHLQIITCEAHRLADLLSKICEATQ